MWTPLLRMMSIILHPTKKILAITLGSKLCIFTRVEKVFRRSILLDYILYMLVGICGALSVPYYVPEIILNRESLFQNDFFIILSKLGIAFTLIFSIPANYNSFRLSFLEQINDKTNDLTEKK